MAKHRVTSLAFCLVWMDAEVAILEELTEKVWSGNLYLPKQSIGAFTWGNVTGIDSEKGLVVVTISGIY